MFIALEIKVMGLPEKKIGYLHIIKYEAATGFNIIRGKNVAGGGVTFQVQFILDESSRCCCCRDKKFQWIQRVIEDTSPTLSITGKQVPYIDSDNVRLPYYRADPGNPPELLDVPFEPLDCLAPNNPNGPSSVKVKFATALVCPSENNRSLASITWGFEFSVNMQRNPKVQSRAL